MLADIPIEKLQELLRDFPYSGWQVAGVASGSILAYQLYKLIHMVYIQPALSPLNDLKIPSTYDNILMGNMATILSRPPGAQYVDWMKELGPIFTYRASFSKRRLFLGDLKAVTYILNRPYDFPKPEGTRATLQRTFGEGLFFAEGEAHKRQRKLMNPCYGPAQVRDLLPIFYTKANFLREQWVNRVQEAGGTADFDVLLGLSRATLDVIGLAGFNYDFDTLGQGETNELCVAFMELFAPVSNPLFDFLQNNSYLLSLIPTEKMMQQRKSKKVMDRVGAKLVADKKAAVLEGGDDKSRDLLSVLIRANLNSSVPEAERMTDREMIDQISTMLIAGHETTSTSLSWLFKELAQPENIHIQDKLRAELQACPSDEPTMEELHAMPYLDAVLRETLRKNDVVEQSFRSSAKDNVIPVSKPYVDRHGVERNEIKIGKGDDIYLSLNILNKNTEIFGEDAHIFNPDRWFDDALHKRLSEVPGVFSGLMSFLGGPRSCIGWRMAILEMKTFIFCLLRTVSVELAPNTNDVTKQAHIVVRPIIKQADGSVQSVLPLRVKLV